MAQRTLDNTPTWAVASVCAIIIIISIVLEKSLHKLGTWFTERNKKALFEALDKVKTELMVLGFISLILTFSQAYIAEICIPIKVANTMLPCTIQGDEAESRRRLLWYNHHRMLAAESTATCSDGHVPLITISGLHQLHILIFFLALFHVIYSAVTVGLARLRIRGWKHWEEETTSPNYEFSSDPSRFRLTHETSFVRAHTSFWTRIPVFFYIGCFFQQFFRPVTKSDYLTLRNGFISVHLSPGSKFNFRKYIQRSLEDDFKTIVGVSPILWASFVLYLLLNVKGWNLMFWASWVPVLIILAVGTELQAIISKMAMEITERHAVVQGIPLVQASDKHFWFGRPQLVHHLIHFALFHNALQITYLLFIWYAFGIKNCFHADLGQVISKIIIGLALLFLCSYITLPQYALITQMGSRMKKSIFDEQTSKALKKWHMTVKKKQGKNAKSRPAGTGMANSVNSALRSSSRSGTLHRFKTTGHSTRSSFEFDDQDLSDHEGEPLTTLPNETGELTVRVENEVAETVVSDNDQAAHEFSFRRSTSLR